MAFTNPQFIGNARLVRAAENAPTMRRGERDREAVRILQHALVGVGASTMRRSIKSDGTLDGDYGGETVRGVQRFQELNGLVGLSGRGDGIAGRNTLTLLDERAPRTPVPLSVTAGPTPTPRAETPETVQPTSTGAVRMPTASGLLREYLRFRDVNGKPCGQNIKHQCAIRMSVALYRCDIGFTMTDDDAEWTHEGTNRRCGIAVPHNASSSRLFPYLQRLWRFEHYTKRGSGAKTAAEIHAAVSGRKGIMYWENCFNGGANVGGDHIDYWDGALMMNDRLNYNGPGERTPGQVNDAGRFFENMARQCWFLPVAP